jgi:hypothetical protein
MEIEDRIAALDWDCIGAELDGFGAATTGGRPLLTPEECAALAGLYPRDDGFRSRIVMARHGFGRGEYKYFAEPLPPLVAALRERLYPRLVPVANRWAETLGEARRRLVPLLVPEAPEAPSLVWVTEFPLFVWDEEWQVLVTEHNPMTPPVPESLPLLHADPGSAVGDSFDLVCNGVEIGSGSSGIDRHDVQVRMLEVMELEPELQHYWIGPLLDCLRTGMPPHEGAGLGLDRVAMILAGERTVREVVAFPQDASGHDLMRDSPSAVGEGKLAEFGLVRAPAQEPAAGPAP